MVADALARVPENNYEAAEMLGVSEGTIRRWRDGLVPDQLRAETRRSLERFLEGGEEAGGDLPDWLDVIEHTVRFAGGAQGLPPDERRRVQRDVLVGVIKLGRAEGKDVTRLEVLLEELGGSDAPLPERVSPAERLIAILDRDSQAALARTDVAKDLSVALRIDAEEARERRARADSWEVEPTGAPRIPLRAPPEEGDEQEEVA